jgi:hypothetical protein
LILLKFIQLLLALVGLLVLFRLAMVLAEQIRFLALSPQLVAGAARVLLLPMD